MWYANGKSGYCCETHPVRFNSGTDESFVCRHAEALNNNAPLQMVAGGTFDLSWDFVATAEHEGDCAVFVTYDVDLPRREQRYVKIANLPYCRQQELQTVTIDIPSGLPAGRALLRWDWLAYHLWPSIEWYAQCADVEIVSSSARSPSSLNSYSIINPPIYPQNCQEGVGCRDPFAGDGFSQRDTGYITGPACFDDTLNQCDLTARGTQGYTGFGGGDTSVVPSPSPTPSPSSPGPSPSPSTGTPSPPPSSSACSKVKYAQCGGSGYTGDTCCPEGMWCMYDNQYWSQCEPCAETWNTACEASSSTTRTTTTTRSVSSPTTPLPADRFEPVDGGSDRACRGATPKDNDASYYRVFRVGSLDDCKARCLSQDRCQGIEHNSGSGRCEVWSRPAGIQASVSFQGYTCLAYQGTCRKDAYAQCGGNGFSGDTCCPAGTWCMTIAACNDPSKWMARCEPCSETWDAAACSAQLSQKSSRRKIKVRKGDLGTAWVQQNTSLMDVWIRPGVDVEL